MAEIDWTVTMPPRIWVDYNIPGQAGDGTPCWATSPFYDNEPRDLKAGDHFIADNHGDGVPVMWVRIYEVQHSSTHDGNPWVTYLWRSEDMIEMFRISGNTFTDAGRG